MTSGGAPPATLASHVPGQAGCCVLLIPPSAFRGVEDSSAGPLPLGTVHSGRTHPGSPPALHHGLEFPHSAIMLGHMF